MTESTFVRLSWGMVYSAHGRGSDRVTVRVATVRIRHAVTIRRKTPSHPPRWRCLLSGENATAHPISGIRNLPTSTIEGDEAPAPTTLAALQPFGQLAIVW